MRPECHRLPRSRPRPNPWPALILLPVLALIPVLASALTGSAISPADTLDSRLPIVDLVHPTGGEVFQSAAAETLRWTIDEQSWRDDPLPVTLTVSDGETLLLEDSVLPEAGGIYAYPWTVTEAHTPNAVFTVEAVDRFGNAGSAGSEPFQIMGSLADVPAVIHRDALDGVSPNPFNPSTTISYSLREAATVDLAIFDLRGRRILNLYSGDKPTGRHDVAWNGRDADGAPMPSGTYLARLHLRGANRSQTFTTHLTLVK